MDSDEDEVDLLDEDVVDPGGAQRRMRRRSGECGLVLLLETVHRAHRAG